MTTAPRISLKIRLHHGDAIALGPGKIELLKALHTTGSISSAARSMKMSYRRAWLLIDTMNQCFKAPLVSTAKGGKGGGGAQLTELGEQVLSQYQQMERTALHRIETDIAALMAHLKPQ